MQIIEFTILHFEYSIEFGMRDRKQQFMLRQMCCEREFAITIYIYHKWVKSVQWKCV